MARPQSVWDFSTPSMDQIGLSEDETDDFHRALHLFELTSAPSLLDDGAANGSMHEPPRGSTEEDSPSELQRGRRSVSLEQKQANNREHQRKFRARSKARQKAVETQLAKTKSELEQLKSKHRQLETMLERASKPSPDPPAQLAAAEDPRNRDIDLSHLLSISIQGQTTHITSDELVSMPVRQFSALWTAYVHELGQSLLQLDEDRTGKAESRLLVLSVEGMRLIGRRLLHNPAAHKALITEDLAKGQPTLLHLDSTFYTNLLGLLDLSKEQVKDLMHIRRLYLTKRGLLALQRRELVSSMAFFNDQLRHPSDNSADAADVGAKLTDNAFEDRRVLYRTSRTVWSGIMECRQLALVMVHSYPYMPILEDFLDSLAAKEGFPSSQEVVANAPRDPMTAAWRDFDEYAMYIHNNMFSTDRARYVPLSWHKAPCHATVRVTTRSTVNTQQPAAPKSQPLEMYLI